jgi:hypothetical protein
MIFRLVEFNEAKKEMDDVVSFACQIITGSANGDDPDSIARRTTAAVTAAPARAALSH